VGDAQRRVRLNGATGRRPRCSQRARPARLLRRPPVDWLLGCSCARTRGWSAPRVTRRDAEQSPPTVADAGAPGAGRAVLGATVWVRCGLAAPGRRWGCRPGFDRRGRAGRSRRRRLLPWLLRPGRSGSHHGSGERTKGALSGSSMMPTCMRSTSRSSRASCGLIRLAIFGEHRTARARRAMPRTRAAQSRPPAGPAVARPGCHRRTGLPRRVHLGPGPPASRRRISARARSGRVLGLDSQRHRLVLGQVVLRPQSLQQVQAQIPP